MKPTKMTVAGRTRTFHCKHANIWPPIAALLEDTPEYLLATNQITQETYARIEVWKRNCGLRDMDATRCPSCPNLLVETEEGGLEEWHQKPTSYRPFATQSRQHARRGQKGRRRKK